MNATAAIAPEANGLAQTCNVIFIAECGIGAAVRHCPGARLERISTGTAAAAAAATSVSSALLLLLVVPTAAALFVLRAFTKSCFAFNARGQVYSFLRIKIFADHLVSSGSYPKLPSAYSGALEANCEAATARSCCYARRGRWLALRGESASFARHPLVVKRSSCSCIKAQIVPE